MLLLILAHAAQAAPLDAATQTAPPDIQLDARVSAREVRIEQRGETSLEVRGGPGSDVRVDKPAANGRQRLRNVDVRVQAEARIAEPQQNRGQPETTEPQ